LAELLADRQLQFFSLMRFSDPYPCCCSLLEVSGYDPEGAGEVGSSFTGPGHAGQGGGVAGVWQAVYAALTSFLVFLAYMVLGEYSTATLCDIIQYSCGYAGKPDVQQWS
jgi:hypothetical protein